MRPSWSATSPMASTSGSDVRAGVVDHHSPALAHAPGRPRAPARRAGGCPAANTTRSTSRSGMRVVGEPQARHPTVGGGAHLGGRRAGEHVQPEPLDVAAQRAPGALVELHGHQPVGELDHGGVDAEQAEGVGRLQAEQAAADHRAGGAAGGPGTDRLEVLDRAVHEGAGGVGAGDGRHERVRPGGEHAGAVGERAPGPGGEGARGGVERDRRVAEHELDAVVGVPAGLAQREVRRLLAVEQRRQVDAVVGDPRLLARGRRSPRRWRPRSTASSTKRWPTIPLPTTTIGRVALIAARAPSCTPSANQRGGSPSPLPRRQRHATVAAQARRVGL